MDIRTRVTPPDVEIEADPTQWTDMISCIVSEDCSAVLTARYHTLTLQCTASHLSSAMAELLDVPVDVTSRRFAACCSCIPMPFQDCVMPSSTPP